MLRGSERWLLLSLVPQGAEESIEGASNLHSAYPVSTSESCPEEVIVLMESKKSRQLRLKTHLSVVCFKWFLSSSQLGGATLQFLTSGSLPVLGDLRASIYKRSL